ncbi:ThuA domain-containing protein [Gynurincola endophyticus]|uniref:ThuA domain-containing protein n=1 Tax=Gynurincola endophyticus TaxID=2479004 RepID=UPI000F8F3025|nr:ThuA domain-containing protein [Gynurincola endophyticus]
MKIFKKILPVIMLFCFIIQLSVAGSLNDKPVQKKVLVLTERGGLHEGFVVAALNWLQEFAQKNKLELRVINHPREIENENLNVYRLFIQLNYPPYNWTDKTMSAFEKYIDEGSGGWIGFHHATLLGEFDGYPLWKWFSDFMGEILFKNYIARKATANVYIENRKHPVMKNLPEVFSVPNDEWYTFDKSPRGKVNVLANVDENSYQPASDIKMGDHPVIWSNENKKARNVYFLMGHGEELLRNEAFTTMFANAIVWALKN